MSGYPPGAATDRSAPWNQKSPIWHDTKLTVSVIDVNEVVHDIELIVRYAQHETKCTILLEVEIPKLSFEPSDLRYEILDALQNEYGKDINVNWIEL